MPEVSTHERHHGFRFSTVDAIAITLCALATDFSWSAIGQHALLFPIVLGHFFLFCNVFRVRRNYELIWAACFLANVTAWYSFGELRWLLVLATQSPMTLAAIGFEISSPRYHGIFSNPQRYQRAPAS